MAKDLYKYGHHTQIHLNQFVQNKSTTLDSDDHNLPLNEKQNDPCYFLTHLEHNNYPELKM